MPSPDCSEAGEALKLWRRELRLRLIAAREAMPAEQHAAKSRLVELALTPLLASLAPRVVGFCWPYRREFDARPVLLRWLKQDASRQVALPVIVAPRAPLIFREWGPETPMREDRHGIPVPASGRALQPDLLMLPLVGFDSRGHRLGYGGGYFDRTVARLSPRPLTIGVGFELGRVDSIRPQDYDIPLNYIVTEAGARDTGPR